MPILVSTDKLFFIEAVPRYTPTSPVRVPVSHILPDTELSNPFIVNSVTHEKWLALQFKSFYQQR